MTTTTLYKIIQSELINRGHNEFFDKDNRLVLFDSEHQFTTKILSFDDDIKFIINDLFHGLSLTDSDYDLHFKRAFLYRFINRQINRQTIETFKFELMSTFLINQDYINRIYNDMEKYLEQTNINDQTNRTDTVQDTTQNIDGTTTSDNRSARADLPQNNVNVNVDNSVITSANENEISRNKQGNNQNTEGNATGSTEGVSNVTVKAFHLDELFKTHGVLDQVMNVFDVKCFLQFW